MIFLKIVATLEILKDNLYNKERENLRLGKIYISND